MAIVSTTSLDALVDEFNADGTQTVRIEYEFDIERLVYVVKLVSVASNAVLWKGVATSNEFVDELLRYAKLKKEGRV